MIRSKPGNLTDSWTGAICLLAILAQTVLPFAHAAYEAGQHRMEPPGSRAAALEDGAETSGGATHPASCPLCHFLGASKSLAAAHPAAPRLGLEAHELTRPDRACAIARRIGVGTAGPRGPPPVS